MTPEINIHTFHRQEADSAGPPDSLSADTEDAGPPLVAVHRGGQVDQALGCSVSTILDGEPKPPWSQISFVLTFFWFD